jgi:hypothetical protein
LLFNNNEDEGSSSSDDEYVDQILSLPEKFAHVPPFNILAHNAVQRPYTLPIQSSDDTNQISGQELGDDSGQSSSPQPSHSKRKRQEVPSGGDLKDSLDSRHSTSRTSTKLLKRLRSTPITPESLSIDKSLLIGRTLLRYFPSHGGAKGLVTKYIIDKDVYQLEYSDGWIESGHFRTMPVVPENERVYKQCYYPVACLIIVLYVDNNGV